MNSWFPQAANKSYALQPQPAIQVRADLRELFRIVYQVANAVAGVTLVEHFHRGQRQRVCGDGVLRVKPRPVLPQIFEPWKLTILGHLFDLGSQSRAQSV